MSPVSHFDQSIGIKFVYEINLTPKTKVSTCQKYTCRFMPCKDRNK
jgi:hypothetical protein